MPYKGQREKKEENDDDEVKVKELFKTPEIVVRTIPETDTRGDTHSIPSYQNQNPIRFGNNIPPRKPSRKIQPTINTAKYSTSATTVELNESVQKKNADKGDVEGMKKYTNKLKSALADL